MASGLRAAHLLPALQASKHSGILKRINRMHALIRFLSHEITSVYSIASKSTALEGRNHSKITPKQCMINKRRVLTGPTIYSPSTESSSSLSSNVPRFLVRLEMALPRLCRKVKRTLPILLSGLKDSFQHYFKVITQRNPPLWVPASLPRKGRTD